MMVQEPVQAAIWHCLNHYDHKNAVFLAERLCTELETDETLFVLATSYYRANRVNQAYWLLHDKPHLTPKCRFLLAKCAFELKKYAEAEATLIINQLPFDETKQYEEITQEFGETACFVLTLLAKIYHKTERPKTAVVALRNALKANPFMWHAFANLCHLGESTEPESIFQIPSTEIFETCLGQTEPQDSMWMSGGSGQSGVNDTFKENEGGVQRLKEDVRGTDLLLKKSAASLAGSQDTLSTSSTITVSTPIDQQQVDTPKRTIEDEIASGELKQDAFSVHFKSSMRISPTASSNKSKSCTVTPCGKPFSYLSPWVAGGAERVHTTLDPSTQTPEHQLACKRVGGTPESQPDDITSPMQPSPSSLSNVGKIEDSDTIISESLRSETIEDGCSSQQSAERFMTLLRSLGTAYKELSLFHCPAAIRQLETHVPRQHLLSSWVQSMIALAHYEQRDFEAAAALFKRVHELDPYRLDHMEIYSSALWQLQRDVELSALAHDLMRIDKKSAITWCVAGNCCSLQKDYATAINYFKRAVQLDMNFVYGYTLLGHEQVAIEELGKAMDAFRLAVLRDPRHYNAWFGMATVYAKQEMYDVAELYFIKALKINPQNSVILVHIGAMQYYMGKVELALQTLNTATLIDPKNPLARFHRGSIYSLMGKHNEALRELEELNEAFPKEADVLYLISKIHKEIGNIEMAMIYCSWASELDPQGLQDNQVPKPVVLMTHKERCCSTSNVSSSDEPGDMEAEIQHEVIADVHIHSPSLPF